MSSSPAHSLPDNPPPSRSLISHAYMPVAACDVFLPSPLVRKSAGSSITK